MKVVILAGGLGTRLMEETEAKPKPMVEIGGKPILWHIMKYYSSFGFNDFILCLGYKSQVIKEYFINYYKNNSDLVVDLKSNEFKILNPPIEMFNITLVETGLNTNTAGRIKKIQKYLDDDTFMLTYGDGVSNINLKKLLDFHYNSNKIATLTSVRLPGRFGNLEIDKNGNVLEFIEKPMGEGSWINGGFFVLNKKIFKYLDGDVDDVQWEKGPLLEIASANQLSAFKHEEFWKCMDAMRDRIELEELWKSENCPWKIW